MMNETWFQKFCEALLLLGYDTPIDAGMDDNYVVQLVQPLFEQGYTPKAAAAKLERDGKAGSWGY